jgi:iron(II)-dependent oxidoreductase
MEDDTPSDLDRYADDDRPGSVATALAPTSPHQPAAGRWFGWLRRSRTSPPASRAAAGPVRGGDRDRPADDLQGMSRRLIADDRYCFVLLREAADQVSEPDASAAWRAMNAQMALIPGGSVPVMLCDGNMVSVELGAYHLDRFAVTNRQYQRFVQAGGYDDLEIWPSEVWPSVARLTDRSGRPGPRNWDSGKFPPALAEHPVIGVCWYEAVAYARWVGKRLPTAVEWQKAGGWPEQLTGGTCNRYPWGNLFEPSRTNLWSAGLGRTVPVKDYPSGATPNGIYQMTGNVWEWLADPLDTVPCQPGEYFQTWKPLRRIIGGAFNTYFPGEATCHFVTGQGELDRRDNIGFRCAVSAEALRPRP